MALTAIELVQLRMLEQGRGTVSDGRDWLRMMVGCALTVFLTVFVAVKFDSPASLAVAVLGVFATVCVVMRAGEYARQELINELRQAQAQG